MKIFPKRFYWALALVLGMIPLLAFGCDRTSASALFVKQNDTGFVVETSRDIVPGEEIEGTLAIHYDYGTYRNSYSSGTNGPIFYTVKISTGGTLLNVGGNCPTKQAQYFRCIAPSAGQPPVAYLNYRVKIDDTIPADITSIKLMAQTDYNNELMAIENMILVVRQPLVHIIDNLSGLVANDIRVAIYPGSNSFTVRGANLEGETVNLSNLTLQTSTEDIRIESNLSASTLAADQTATFSVYCHLSQPGIVSAVVNLSHSLSNQTSPISFVVVCRGDGIMQVLYEGTRVDRKGLVEIAPGYHTFVVKYLTRMTTPLDVSNPVLEGDPKIILDSGMRSSQIMPNQETFFILNCTAAEDGIYTTSVSIGNSLGSPYIFAVVCKITSQPDTLFPLDPSTGNTSGGNDVTNPPFVPGDPPNNTLNTDTTGGNTTTNPEPPCPLDDC